MFQVIGSFLLPLRKRVAEALQVKEDSIGHHVLKTMATFVMVDFTWIFFRAESVHDALHMIKSILTIYNPWIFMDGSIYKLGLSQKQFHLVLFSIAILFVADWLKYRNIKILDKILEQNIWCRWTVYLTGILFVLIFGIWGNTYDAQAFVYFQF